jgi:hypothetical protein
MPLPESLELLARTLQASDDLGELHPLLVDNGGGMYNTCSCWRDRGKGDTRDEMAFGWLATLTTHSRKNGDGNGKPNCVLLWSQV